MSKIEFDVDTLAGLTDEEREAITGEVDPSEGADVASLKRIADASGNDDDEDEDDDSEDDAGAAPVEVAKADPVPDAVDEVKPQAKAEPEPKQEAFRPTYQAELPPEFKHTSEEVQEHLDSLAAKYKDGEIEFDEFQTGTKNANAYLNDMSKAQLKVEIANEMRQQAGNQEWQFHVKTFLRGTPDGIDYNKDADKYADLDTFVKALAVKPENNDKPPEWFLQEGHKRVRALHGLGVVEPKKNSVQEAKNARKPNLEGAPKSLAMVPSSDGPNDVSGDEFSDIDRLSGDAFEAAIASMSASKRQQFMNRP